MATPIPTNPTTDSTSQAMGGAGVNTNALSNPYWLVEEAFGITITPGTNAIGQFADPSNVYGVQTIGGEITWGPDTQSSLPPSGAAGGDLAGTYPNPTLKAIGSATGPTGDATHVPVVTIDTKGRVTALTSATIVGPFPPNGAAGGVLSGTYPNPGFATTPIFSGGAAGGVLTGTYPNPSTVVGSGIRLPYNAQTANYTILVTDFTIDCTSGTFTVKLPTAGLSVGQAFNVVNSGAGTITLDGNGNNIMGAGTQTVNAGTSVGVQWSGAQWIWCF